MPDQDDRASPTGGDDDDAALAAVRLERALDRIAASAHPYGPRYPVVQLTDGAAVTREVAARLELLIAHVQAALDQN